MSVFAKSYPITSPQTLWEHTQDVMANARELKNNYPSLGFLDDNEEYFWDALDLVCKTHDLGKIATPFQYKICKAISTQCEKNNIKLPLPDINQLKTDSSKIPEIPHNILSPAFVLGSIQKFPEDIQNCIFQAIAYHHNRGRDLVNPTSWGKVKQAIADDLRPSAQKLSELEDYFSSDLLIGDKYMTKLRPEIISHKDFYMMLKGFLHRADYCASANVPVLETAPNYSKPNMKKYISNFANPWQLDALSNNLDENIIMLAGTGMGKTEFALYWAAGKKMFYTLPIRTSVNAIYERIKTSFGLDGQQVGLLHSNAEEYLISSIKNNGPEEDGINQLLSTIDTMRNLSMQVAVSTADQIFSSVYHYPGYERIYSTMVYSRIIIDELQAYDPGIIAAILHGLVDFSRLGAKFCIITATLPEFCISYLDERIGKIAKPPKQYRKIPRHLIKLVDGKIDEMSAIDIIKRHATDKDKKILIIANTVKSAIGLKKLLDGENIESDLLHSRFTYEDRMKKERDGILAAKNGIWITTQVVEASVDIDFDVLITEISTMDSQIQRWGRIWRNRDNTQYTKNTPNIYILKHPSDGGKIYHKDMVSKTLNVLASVEGKTLSDNDAFTMFNEVFSNKALEDTDYLDSFEKSVMMIEDLNFTADSRADAQRLFRDVPNISVIPKPVYDEYKTSIDQSISDLHQGNKIQRKKALTEIKNKTAPIHKKYAPRLDMIDAQYCITVADLRYSFDYGVEY